MATTQVRHAGPSRLAVPIPSTPIDYSRFEPRLPTRCDSDKSTGSDNEMQSPLAALQAPIQIPETLKAFGEASQHQVRWDSAMCNELKLPENYHSVAVLLIKWREDDFKRNTCQEEVGALETVFREKFNYHTKIIDLAHDCTCPEKCDCSPQNRFDRTVSRFMDKWDGEHNLVIVYYTGHGSHFPESGTTKAHLSLHATADSAHPDVHWNQAEHNFVHSARGDVLTIMDACFAGNVAPTVDRVYDNIYEYIGACHKGKMTSSPGNRSFTSALITSLNHLFESRARQSFTTAHLISTIAEQPLRRNCPPFFDSRGASSLVDRRILLAPQRPCGETCFENTPIPTYLTLRIELKDENLDPDQVEELARKVAKAVKASKIRTRRVDWVRLAGRKSPSLRAAARSVIWISTLGRPRKGTLQTIPEEPNIDTPISRPGIWATFGVLTPWKRSHTVTLPLVRPWTRIVGGGLGAALLFGIYCLRRRMSPLALLYILLKKTNRSPIGGGLG
ncbi:hypothetical protein E2P81_ATG00031 [Venturia nashicola]|uniref:Peptidase C14 caspase domain-containing protein n=1 Tax=Venturia nashicola TaxID=86259 RepID=A0A4Z1PSK4_9PEZI|nr:hypothetical protein E6O75_ATG00035 [Venturia nashicola]TLD39044.1 hypothetical protein E2P81_ATG00031 [Venturia nashicola]